MLYLSSIHNTACKNTLLLQKSNFGKLLYLWFFKTLSGIGIMPDHFDEHQPALAQSISRPTWRVRVMNSAGLVSRALTEYRLHLRSQISDQPAIHHTRRTKQSKVSNQDPTNSVGTCSVPGRNKTSPPAVPVGNVPYCYSLLRYPQRTKR